MTNTEKARMVDEETGVIYELTPIDEKPKRGKKPLPSTGFTQTWMLEVAALQGRVSRGAFGMFLVMSSAMDPKLGGVNYNLEDIRVALGFNHTSSVSNILSELIEAGAVHRTRRGEALMNPNYVWRGTSGDRSIAIYRWHLLTNPTEPWTGGETFVTSGE